MKGHKPLHAWKLAKCPYLLNVWHLKRKLLQHYRMHKGFTQQRSASQEKHNRQRLCLRYSSPKSLIITARLSTSHERVLADWLHLFDTRLS